MIFCRVTSVHTGSHRCLVPLRNGIWCTWMELYCVYNLLKNLIQRNKSKLKLIMVLFWYVTCRKIKYDFIYRPTIFWLQQRLTSQRTKWSRKINYQLVDDMWFFLLYNLAQYHSTPLFPLYGNNWHSPLAPPFSYTRLHRLSLVSRDFNNECMLVLKLTVFFESGGFIRRCSLIALWL